MPLGAILIGAVAEWAGALWAGVVMGGRLRCRHAGGARRQTTDLEPVDPEDLQALRIPYESYNRHRRLDLDDGLLDAPPQALYGCS
jgi:hypothetical protein